MLTTPIGEEGSNNDICWIPLEELPTKDTTPEDSRSLQGEGEASPSLQEGDEASPSLQEGDEVSRSLQEADEVSRASQSGGASGDHDIAPQLNRPPLTDEEQAGLDQQELPDLGGHLRQEKTPSRDIYQEDLEQIPDGSTQASRDTSGRVNTRDMANIHTQSKPRLNYTILHRTGRKELAAKAIYLTLEFAHAFVNALLRHQWTRTIKGLPPEPCNWTQFKAA